MAGTTYYLRNKILDHLFGGVPYAPNSSMYFGYMTGSPSPAGPGAEPAGGSYARIGVVNDTTSFPTTATKIKTLAIDIDFPKSTANQGSVVAIGCWDSPTSGNLLCWWDLPAPKVIDANMKMNVPAGALEISLPTTGGLSAYVKNGIINHVFGGVMFSPEPLLYAGYMTTAPTETVPGTEPSAAGYARVSFNNTLSMFPSASNGVKQNALMVNFPEASGDQGTVTFVGYWDAQTGGNFIFYYSVTSRNVIALDVPQIASNSITLSLT